MHRRTKPLSRRLLARAPATLAVLAALVSPPLVTGTAHASGDCGTATTAAATLACAEQVFTTAVDAVTSAEQSAGGVSVPVPPIVDETSLLNLVNQTAVQGVQQAENCVSQTDPTCALIIQVATQQARSIESFATTCVGGTNTVCNQLEQLTNSEIAALVTLATNCVGGTDPTCNNLLGTVSQLLGEAVTCAVGPVGPAASSTLPDPLVIDSGGGSGLPAPVTCQQVKDAAAQLIEGCKSGADAACAPAIMAVEKSPCLNSSDLAACAQTITPAPVPVQTDVDPGTVFPTDELRGTIVLGSGLGAAGVPVSFYVAPTMETADTVTPDLLGSGTTDANGNYAVTITPDTYATSLATANNGVLNVLISAAVSVSIPGTVDPPILEIADGQTPLVLGGSAEYWESQPPTLLLQPAGQTDLPAPPAADLSAPDPTSPTVDPSINYLPPTNSLTPTFAGVPTGADPFIVNGIDYRQAMPVSGGGGCAPPHGQPYLDTYTTIGEPISKNVEVGEAHAWYDTTAEFTYGETADSELETAFSSNDETWLGGTYSHVQTKNDGVATGLAPHGPYWGHQILVSFQFKNWKIRYQCYDSDKVYYEYEVGPTKCLFKGSIGKDVSKYDGDAYFNSNPKYRSTVSSGFWVSLTKGSAYRYTNSWSAFGFSGKSVSGHSKYVIQKITAGDGDLEHDIWGSNKAIRDNPAIMYSF